MLLRITSPYFVAGVVLEDGIITEAAPILKWAIGKEFLWFRNYCLLKKKWRIEIIHDKEKNE